MAKDIWRSLGLDIININVYVFVFQNTLWFNRYGQFLLTDYRRTHNFTNWLQSAQRRGYPVLMNSSNAFYFCRFINSVEFLYERFINYWSSHVESFHKKYEPFHEIICPMPYANNEGVDQPAHPHSLMSTFDVHCRDSVIHIIAKSKISKL